MVIIGFSTKTGIPLVRICCRHFKHCVVISGHNDKFILHQFVRRNYVKKIPLDMHGMAQLKNHSWVFILSNRKRIMRIKPHAFSCVDYVKTAIGLNKFWIQTPDSLYKYLTKKLT